MIAQPFCVVWLLAIFTLPTVSSLNTFKFSGVSQTVKGRTYKDCSGTVTYKSLSPNPLNPICLDVNSIKVTNFKCETPQVPPSLCAISMTDVPFSKGGFNARLSGTGLLNVADGANGVGTVDFEKATVCKV